MAVSPLVDYGALATASYEGDTRLVIWVLSWDAHAILSGTPLFDANIYHPERRAFRFAEHHIGLALFGLPFYAATKNPVLTYWLLWLLAFPLNALAMHALAWRVTRDHLAAFAAGCVFAFCFFRMHHAHGHLQLLWTWAIPLLPLSLDAWLRRPTIVRAAAVTALVLIPALTSLYLAVFVALLALVSAAFLMRGVAMTRTHVLRGLTAMSMGGAIFTWFALPYVALAPGPMAEVASGAADIKAYLVPPENTWLGQRLMGSVLAPRWIWGEQTLYAGIAVIVMSCLGLAGLMRIDWVERQREALIASAVVVCGALALALSFGPTETGMSPFDLLARLPGLGLLRAPARFALLVMMAAAVLTALGVSWLRQRWPSIATPVAGLVLAVFFAESFVVAFPAGKPKPMAIPRVYRLLATLPPGGVLSLPTYRATPEAFRESDYLLFSTAHWQPIVNGFGRQEPPLHAERMETLTGFPSPASLDLMRKIGVRYVVLHTRRARELAARRAAAEESAAVRLIEEADGDLLFELR